MDTEQEKARRRELYRIKYETNPVFRETKRERSRLYRLRYPDKHKSTILKTIYHITLSEYQSLLAEQGGCCAICGRHESEINSKRMLCVDHDHQTGQVRGIVCQICNMGLGAYENKKELFEAYLKRAEDRVKLELSREQMETSLVRGH